MNIWKQTEWTKTKWQFIISNHLSGRLQLVYSLQCKAACFTEREPAEVTAKMRKTPEQFSNTKYMEMRCLCTLHSLLCLVFLCNGSWQLCVLQCISLARLKAIQLFHIQSKNLARTKHEWREMTLPPELIHFCLKIKVRPILHRTITLLMVRWAWSNCPFLYWLWLGLQLLKKFPSSRVRTNSRYDPALWTESLSH